MSSARRGTRFWIGALAAALVAGSGAASAQSLADIAAREQARRKAVKSDAKVYKNEDLGPNSEAPPQAAAPAPAPASQIAGPGGTDTTAASGAETAPPTGDAQAAAGDSAQAEQQWRARIQSARSELQRNELFLEALQSRINALTTDFVNRDDPAQRAVIANDRQRALAEMERVKATIESLRKQIADIEEEARRAGVPPGWLR
jgi:hypothetical protein